VVCPFWLPRSGLSSSGDVVDGDMVEGSWEDNGACYWYCTMAMVRRADSPKRGQ
jgi:hypothetical protein